MDKRTPRTTETREATSRKKSWAPPSVLPTPDERAGWVHRWIRAGSRGNVDTVNVSGKLRQGWEICKAEEYPEMTALRDINSQFKDGIEHGGLILCRAPKEIIDERNAYYREMADSQLRAVESNLMRESDSRMPISRPQISTKVTFGSGN